MRRCLASGAVSEMPMGAGAGEGKDTLEGTTELFMDGPKIGALGVASGATPVGRTGLGFSCTGEARR